MITNFIFLNKRFPALEKMGALAEGYLYSDPNGCLYKMGILAETLVNYMFDLESITPSASDNTQANRTKTLLRLGKISKEISDILHAVRLSRNEAVHGGYDCIEKCKTLLQMTHTLSVWFMRVYGDPDFAPVAFVMPEDMRGRVDYHKLLEDNKKLLAQLEEEQAAELLRHIHKRVSAAERKLNADKANLNLRLSEREARYLIDEQLRKVGWEADSQNLRYSQGARPEKGRNMAIAEWPTDSAICKWGYIDYALFAGLKLIGVVEAKASRRDIAAAIENQCREYSIGVKEEHLCYVINAWGEYKVPFLFAANGKLYARQPETGSGVWFLDARDASNKPKSLQGWMDPHGLLDMLKKDIAAANRRLVESSYDLLRDKEGLSLRPYQIEAVESAEAAIVAGRQTALLAMAPGTGKTRTMLGMIHRFLKSGRFKRVLLIVERDALGEQALDSFKETKIAGHISFGELHDIKEFDETDRDRKTKVHVATVKSLVEGIIYNDAESMPSVTGYDLIVADEAHRSQSDDYLKDYRSVIEYFEAAKIALTATSALDTTEIFGKPVFEYTYQRAVTEGYLAGHNAPRDIGIKLTGENAEIYEETANSWEIEDELDIDIDNLNRLAIEESFNRAVFQEIARGIDPQGSGKTLIYAVDDDHADLIVKILREIYEPLGIMPDAIMKINSGIDGSALQAVKRFKRDRYPNIAVTVDLLATGINVPEITTLVFMRRVKSRILFEQMLGRATRLCPEIGKTHFDVYDPVGVYESFGAVCSIKPVMRNLSLTFYIESIDKIAVRLEEAAGLIINAAKELKNLR